MLYLHQGHASSLFAISVQAGICNINAYFRPIIRNWGGNVGQYTQFNGAFYQGSTYNCLRSQNGGGLNDVGTYLYFDASRSNSIYGRSNTVTPLSKSCKFFIRY